MSDYVERILPQNSPLWKQKAPLLPQLDIELTERCNNDCIHCCINLPASDREARARELPTAEIKRILDEAAGLGCLSVRYTGGEPLVRSDFEELYLYARRLGMKVVLYTNARLVTPRLADLFAKVPPSPIEVTVYGMRAESYEAVTRAPGSFVQFRRGVDLLLERQIAFVVRSVVLPPNRAEMAEFEAWAATIPCMEGLPPYVMFFDLRGRRDDPEKNREIRSLRVSGEEGMRIMYRGGGGVPKVIVEFCRKFVRPAGDKLFFCGLGEGACVDAYGRFQACLLLRVPELSYDLRQGTLRDALENHIPRLQAMKASNPEYLARCARCFLHGLCDQCPAKSWTESGTLDTPNEYLCEIAHAQARHMGLIGIDERAWEVVDWHSRIEALDAVHSCRPRKC
ncbi:MAG: radical SAM protein [Terriglobia bacterium]|jgi:radical SAM protein with 4Fe4S-binding SPASM domain